MSEKESTSAVNERLKTISIKGKEYVTVNQRVLAFWELYPNGSIITELVSDDGSRCVFKATVLDGDMPISTGHAFETKEGMINKTSYIENCETSAVGRALGFLGIGATEFIASADEMTSAINQQKANQSFVGACTVCGMQYLFENEAQLAYSICQCGNATFTRV